MAYNLSIESPDFDRIRKGDDKATENAVRLLWFVLNDEISRRRRGIREASQSASYEGVLGSDVSLSTPNSYYALVNTGELPAGTYLVTAHVTVYRS